MKDSITKIEWGKGAVQVCVNGEGTLYFPRAAFEERGLCQGEAVDLEELMEWLLPRQYPDALSKAVTFLAVRARSTLEIRQKLENKGYMERTIDLVLYKLTKERLLDDKAFAGEWVKSRAGKQLGKYRILRELRQKGIPQDMAEAVLAELENEEESGENACKLASKLLRRVQNEPDAKKAMRKVMAAMERRGFPYDEAKTAVEAAISEMAEDSDV